METTIQLEILIKIKGQRDKAGNSKVDNPAIQDRQSM